MKKIILLAALSFAAVTVNAQWFVGGSVGFGTSTAKEGDNKATFTTFGLNPEVGYSFHDRWDVGIEGGYNFSTMKLDEDGDKVKGGAWHVAPFIQYSAVEFKNFEIQFRADVHFAGGDLFVDATGDLPLGHYNDNFDAATEIGLNITPIVAYNISDRFQIRAALNFASLGFNYTKEGDLKTTDFGLAANTRNLMNTNDFQLGFIVRF